MAARRKLSLNDDAEAGGASQEGSRSLLRSSGHESPGGGAYLELRPPSPRRGGAMSEEAVAALVAEQQFAVEAEDLERSYGDVRVLRGIDMAVPVGAVYALLGASGCGKSTLIKLVLGQLHVHGGAVRVFGRAPGERDHPVPGPAVGYMPQETALEPEFTIDECVRYHAKLHGMDDEVFARRKGELLELLDMPPEDRLVRSLSGGQRRRVSLMVALIHRPPLLVLDEPTVGVDPVLRKRIWDYLSDLTSDTGCSIVITTHYIGDAMSADLVGFMRGGKILGEGRPADLMRRHKKDDLEEVFLELCFERGDDGRRLGASSLAARDDGKADAGHAAVKGAALRKLNPREPPSRCRCRVVGALVWKGMVRMRRNIVFLATQFLLPSVQVILFCLAVGGNPEHLGLCVVNGDGAGGRGEALVRALDAGSAFDVVRRGSEKACRGTVEDGHTWGCVYIPANFTAATEARYGLHESGAGVIEQSTVSLQLDSSDQQISVFIQERVAVTLDRLLNVTTLSNPVNLEPVYGSRNPKFTDFIAPGIVVSIAFSSAIGLTAVSFAAEKKSGLLERAWAAGVRPVEVLLSHVFNVFGVLFVQISLLLMFALLIFELPMKGSLVLAVAVAQLLGLCGMVYGLVIASFVANEEAASQLALGSFFPALLLSGVLWPLQAIPPGLYYFALSLPTTWAAEAMRSIMSRGWGMLDQRVYTGFAVVLGWTVLFFACSVRGLKSRS